MSKVQRQFREDELLYDTFRPLRELGRGGQARVLEVRADRNAPGFSAFLAFTISWQEVINNKQIVPLRLRVAALNRDLQNLEEEEAEFMDAGDEDLAEEVRADIEALQEDIQIQVDSLKAKQQYYIDKRHTVLTDASPEAMLKHLAKLGVDYPDDDIFAMKQILIDDDKAALRLQDEFRSINLVQHENILSVYTMGEDYYIMELIRGKIEFKRVISTPEDSDQYFTNEERINIILQAARAAEHAHAFGIVHRDIKPDNITVDEEGNVKLIDFGLAKSVETEGMTVTGAAMGTPHFMSPEQIESAKDASPSFDIYGLGASLYSYITGKKPYQTARNKYSGEEKHPTSVQDVFLTVCNLSYLPVPPSEIADGIPLVLDDIILKAMAKEKHFRYQSVKEFRTDLEKYLSLADGESLQSGSFFNINSQVVDMRVRRREYRSSHDRTRGGAAPPIQKIIIGAFAGIAALLLIASLFTGGAEEEEDEAAAMRREEKSEKEESAREMYEYAEEYAEAHPLAFQACINRFQKVKAHAAGTKYELMADDQMEELREGREVRKLQVLADLESSAAQLIANNDYDRAIEIYTGYTGKLSGETEEARASKAREVAGQRDAYLHAQELKQAAAEARLAAVRKDEQRRAAAAKVQERAADGARLVRVRGELRGMASKLKGVLQDAEYEKAGQLVSEWLAREEYDLIQKELEQMQRTVKAAQDLHQTMAGHFRDRIGTKIAIPVGRRVRKGTVTSVEADAVSLEHVFGAAWDQAKVTERIAFKDIALQEKMTICEPDLTDPDVVAFLVLEAESTGETRLQKELTAELEDHILITGAMWERTEPGPVIAERIPEPVMPAPIPKPRVDTSGPGWIDLLEGYTLARAGWQHNVSKASLGTGCQIQNGALTKFDTDKDVRVDKIVEFREGEIVFDYDMKNGYWEFSISESPDTGNVFHVKFADPALRGKHQFRLVVLGGNVTCFLDGAEISGNPVRIDSRLKRAIENKSQFSFFAQGLSSLAISNMKCKPLERGVKAGRNLLPFGDFEETVRNRFVGWDTIEGMGESVFRDTAIRHSGNSALRMENLPKKKDGHVLFYEARVPVKRRCNYRLVFWMKTENIPPRRQIGALVQARKPRPAVSAEDCDFQGTQDWRRYEFKFNTGYADQINVYFGVWNGRAEWRAAESGKVWFDDIALYDESGGPAPQAEWTYLFSGNDDTKLKHRGVEYNLADGVLRLGSDRNGSMDSVGMVIPETRIELEYEAKLRTDKQAFLFLKGVQYKGGDRCIGMQWDSDGTISIDVDSHLNRLAKFTRQRYKRRSPSDWQRFSFVIDKTHVKALWNNLVFYDGPLPAGYPNEIGFRIKADKPGFIEIRNARYKILEAKTSLP